jgi:putative oxidoreductase
MSSNSVSVADQIGSWSKLESRAASSVNAAVVLAGRVLFSFLFIKSSLGHFSSQTIAYAASQGVPLASIVVPISGVLALAGGLSILLGYRARLGAWLIALFLVPVTFMMHKFWTVADPMMAQMQQIMFMKNMTMLGAALLISQLGAGPLSLDTRQEQ